jgi:membrane associated rhomboid family serine protease
MPPRRPDLAELLGRLPVVSLGIAASFLLVCLVVQLGFASPLAEGRLLVRQAIDHVISHPSLEVSPRLVPAVRHALPTFEGNEMFAFLRDGKPSADQTQLDVLTSRSFDKLDSHPYRALGLVPARGDGLAFATHAFVHGGWIHTLLTCLLLLMAGPLLEAVWGRRLFAAACAGSVLFGALVFRLVHADLDRALLGGGALVSALVAASLVRFWEQEVDLAGWLSPLSSLELRVPSWALGAGWGFYQVALIWAAGGDLPGGLHNAQGISASLAAAAAGAGIAFGVSHTGLEGRLGTRVAASARSLGGHFDIEKVKRARARGDLETAFQMLRAEARRSARNRDMVTLFWEIAVEHDQAEAAAPAMLQLIREELRRGAMETAVSQWRRLGERVPGALLEPAALLKLLPLIRSKLGDDAAVLALHQAVDPANRGFTAEVGAEIARTAAEIEPEVACKAANRALKAQAIAPELVAELSALLTRLTPKSEDSDDAMGPAPVVAMARFDDVDDHDRSDFGAVDDLSADPPAQPAPAAPAATPPEAAAPLAAAQPVSAEPAAEPTQPPESAPVSESTQVPEAESLFPGVRVANAVPVSLGEDELGVYLSGQGPSKLAYGRIRAVSLAAVRGLGPKPVVLLDLLLAGPQPGPKPLPLVRLRSDQYDPRKLVPSAAGPLQALLALAEELLKRTRGAALPDAEAARGRPLRQFDSLDAYNREVLRAAAADPTG